MEVPGASERQKQGAGGLAPEETKEVGAKEKVWAAGSSEGLGSATFPAV